MKTKEIAQQYLTDLDLVFKGKTLLLVNELQKRHVAKYTFNSLSVVLGQEMPLELEHLFDKIVKQRRGGYCFEHNKLVLNVLATLGYDVRLLLCKVVYNRDVDVARTHRVTLLNFEGEQYIVDAGFGSLGAREPVKLVLNEAQDQGDYTYRIVQADNGEYCYQLLKGDVFFTLYTFNLQYYTEAECTPAHFYSHKSPDAAFVNNLVVSLKTLNRIDSLRNSEYHRTVNGELTITQVTAVEQLHDLLVNTFSLSIDVAVSEFLFAKFLSQ